MLLFGVCSVSRRLCGSATTVLLFSHHFRLQARVRVRVLDHFLIGKGSSDLIYDSASVFLLLVFACFLLFTLYNGWWENFRDGHPELSLRTPNNLERSHTSALTREVVENLFACLKTTLKEIYFFRRNEGYGLSVCVSVIQHLTYHPTNDICAVFSENAPWKS